jgi:uncharacterized protein (DUF697 family)
MVIVSTKDKFVRDLIDAGKNLLDAINAADQIVDDNFPERIAEIVKFQSKGAAAAALASGWIPGAGSTIASTTAAGFIWVMYGKINSECKLPFSENVIKSLASGLATNLASYMIGGFVLSTAFSLFPGIGSIGASAVIGGTVYALTLASGIVYLKVLTNLFESGIDPTQLSEDELKMHASNVTENMDIKDTLDKAKKSYKNS